MIMEATVKQRLKPELGGYTGNSTEALTWKQEFWFLLSFDYRSLDRWQLEKLHCI